MKYQDSEGVEIAKQQMIAEKDVDAMSEIFDMFGDSKMFVLFHFSWDMMIHAFLNGTNGIHILNFR